MAIWIAAAVPAQESGPPEINYGNRVLHLYVDPIYGEDESRSGANPAIDCADRNNPGPLITATTCGLTPAYPSDVFDPNQSFAPLLHNPTPFRTITRAINTIPALPWVSSWSDPVTGTRYVVTWSHAIVHLLPGVYACGQPLNSNNQFPGPEVYDWSNGLRHNREVFPIRVPTRVSIQGTSALNTMIELHHSSSTTSANTMPEVFGPALVEGGSIHVLPGANEVVELRLRPRAATCALKLIGVDQGVYPVTVVPRTSDRLFVDTAGAAYLGPYRWRTAQCLVHRVTPSRVDVIGQGKYYVSSQPVSTDRAAVEVVLKAATLVDVWLRVPCFQRGEDLLLLCESSLGRESARVRSELVRGAWGARVQHRATFLLPHGRTELVVWHEFARRVLARRELQCSGGRLSVHIDSAGG